MKVVHSFVVALIFAFLVSIVANAADFTGPAIVHDGDTLTIDKQHFRLLGIDAPELAQTCQMHDGSIWHCGVVAGASLRVHIWNRPVRCTTVKKDHFGRSLAECFLGTESLNAWMVENGLAVAYRKYSTKYVPLENEARKALKGIWEGTFVPPEQWRRTH